jgi:hypothetical protein
MRREFPEDDGVMAFPKRSETAGVFSTEGVDGEEPDLEPGLKRLGLGMEDPHEALRTLLLLRELTYGNDIDDLLEIKNVLELQPLHKRVLSLIEYVVMPKLKRHSVGASSVWDSAFTKGSGPLGSDRDVSRVATLIAHHVWLNISGDSSNTVPRRLGLRELLDGLVREVSRERGFGGMNITLTPATPADHARQLEQLSKVGDLTAARMTFYLGKVALIIRNFIEHGHEYPENGCLNINNSEFWYTTRTPLFPRKGRPEVLLTWLKREAKAVMWHGVFPSKAPGAAEELLLDGTSLRKCLVLMSLVLHAAHRHLNLPI